MSWNLQFVQQKGESAKSTFERALRKGPTPLQTNEVTVEAQEQLEVAVEMAQRIIDSGVLGAGPFHGELSGHANPERMDHPPAANSFLTINVAAQPVIDHERQMSWNPAGREGL